MKNTKHYWTKASHAWKLADNAVFLHKWWLVRKMMRIWRRRSWRCCLMLLQTDQADVGVCTSPFEEKYNNKNFFSKNNIHDLVQTSFKLLMGFKNARCIDVYQIKAMNTNNVESKTDQINITTIGNINIIIIIVDSKTTTATTTTAATSSLSWSVFPYRLEFFMKEL